MENPQTNENALMKSEIKLVVISCFIMRTLFNLEIRRVCING